MGWFLRGAPWQVTLLVGLALLGFAGFRFSGHQHGGGMWAAAAAGTYLVVRALMRARRGGSRS